jgi:hypothetical protein
MAERAAPKLNLGRSVVARRHELLERRRLDTLAEPLQRVWRRLAVRRQVPEDDDLLDTGELRNDFVQARANVVFLAAIAVRVDGKEDPGLDDRVPVHHGLDAKLCGRG